MKIWVYKCESQQGPFDVDQLKQMHITPDTPIWYEGLDRWTPAGESPLAAELYGAEEPAERQTEVEDDAETADTFDFTQGVDPVVNHGLRKVATAKTYIGWAIALNICCCGSPFSIAALVASIITIVRNNAGDEDGAQKASNVTEWLIIIAIALGVPMMFVYSLISAI
jgi:hypothetical protein